MEVSGHMYRCMRYLDKHPHNTFFMTNYIPYMGKWEGFYTTLFISCVALLIMGLHKRDLILLWCEAQGSLARTNLCTFMTSIRHLIYDTMFTSLVCYEITMSTDLATGTYLERWAKSVLKELLEEENFLQKLCKSYVYQCTNHNLVLWL